MFRCLLNLTMQIVEEQLLKDGRLSERSIHTFLCMSAQALGYTYFRLSAQAFRTKHTHFPLYVGAGSGVYILSLVGTSFQNEAYTLSFVCRRRLWGIHTFACRHKLSERSIHTFLCMSAQALGYTYFRLSAQAFRTGHTHFLFTCVFVSAGSELYTLSLDGTGSYRTKHTHFFFDYRRRLWVIVFMLMDNNSFTNWTGTRHTHIVRFKN